MVRAFVALSLLTASAAGFAAGVKDSRLAAVSPWWEKVTVSVPPSGAKPSCTFTSSDGTVPTACDVDNKAELQATAQDESQVTTITFERRFAPGPSQPVDEKIGAGETLLGGQVLMLAIDGAGKVSGCRVVEQAGDLEPDYGCKDASAELFKSSANEEATKSKVGYLTVLVYAHKESLT